MTTAPPAIQRMVSAHSADRGTRVVIIAASLVIVFWGINYAQSVLVVFLVSGFLAMVSLTPVQWMQRKGLSTVGAVLVAMGAMITVLVLVGMVVGASINQFSQQLPHYQARLTEMFAGINATIAARGVPLPESGVLGYINPAGLMNLTGVVFGALSSVLSNVFLILFTVMFILLESSSFPIKLRYILGDPHAAFPQFGRFARDLKRYVVIMTVMNFAGGFLIALWLTILGVDYAIMWGVLAFLLTYIPSIGSIVAALPAILLALVQRGGTVALLAAIGYLVIGSGIGNVLAPRIMGHRLGISTLVVFLSLIVWGYLLGLVGALLCVPLTMVVMLACEMTEETQWIAVLLGPATPVENITPKLPNGG